MKAAQIDEYGDSSKISIKEIERPELKPGQVLVEVKSSSINPFDTMVREGYLKEMIPLELPVTLGGDIAGVISEVADDVDGLNVGDKVYGQANVVAGNSGAFAEFATTSSSQVSVMPSNVDFNQAASLALVGVSAVQALYEHLNLQAGQKILIHGGSGGIGSIAIQIAKHLGAYVATTATGDGIEYVKNLGADEVVDYKSENFDEVLSDFDAVFDTVAGETYDRSFKVLKKGGVIVSMNAQPNQELMDKYSVNSIAQMTHVNNDSLERLTSLVESGVVTPHVDKVFTLEEIAEAFAARESGKVLGKIVISVN